MLIHISEGLPLCWINVSINSLVQHSEDLLLGETLLGKSAVCQFDLLLGQSLLNIFSGLLLKIFLLLVFNEADPISQPECNFGEVAEETNASPRLN